MAVCRLAPGDHHRFHWPIDGRWEQSEVVDVPGEYHSVAPLCVAGAVDVLGRNRRAIVMVDSDEFGDAAIVVVGAVKVGSIEFTAPSGPVRRGDEMGTFRYGGSTVVVVFGTDRIEFDTDLRTNSDAGLETLIRTGTRLGTAVPPDMASGSGR